MLLLQRFALFFFLTASLAGPTLGQPAEPPPDSLRAEALIQEARALYGAGDHPAALEKASQAFELFQKRYGDEHSTTARARMFVAREYRNLGREADALHLFEVSLLFFESRSDTFRIVVSHLNMGLCLRDLFRNAEAHRHFQTGIELLRPDSARQAVIIADLYVGVGSVYNAERQYAAAIPVLENAREVYTLLRRTDACGMAKYHLGGAWLGLHDYFRAREYYLGALADLKDKLRPGHPYFADLYVKIGVCCQKTGASELGLQHLLEAKASYLQAGSETLDYLQFLKYLGEFYLEEGNSAAAIQQLEECLRGKEKQFGPQSLHLLGALQALADAWLLAAAPGRAEMYSRRALQLLALAADSDRPAASPFYRQLAEANEQLGNWPAALAFCDSAFAAAGLSCAQAGRMQPRDQARALCQRRATAFRLQYQQTGDTTALFHAESCFAQAAALLDQEIETISSGGARHSFYDRAHRLFEQWLDCRLEGYARTADRQHALAAFEIASRSKAFLLRKAILQSGALQFAGLPDSALLLERQLRVQIANVEAQLDTAQLSGRALTGDGQLAASQVLADLRNRYDALLIRIEQQFPAYFHLQHPERPENAWAACRRALAPGQALLLYSQTDRGFCAFVLRQDTFFLKILSTAPELDEQVLHFRRCLTAFHTAADPTDAEYDRQLDSCILLAQALYRQLVLPVAALLPGRVVVVPDGKLWHLPFEALLSAPPADVFNLGAYRFFGFEKALSYALSPDFLAQTKTPASNHTRQNLWLGLAPFASLPDSGWVWPALPYSGEEVRAIAALLHGTAWLGKEARPGRFVEECRRFKIVHLATHSFADDRLGDYGGLALSAVAPLTPAKEIYRLRLPAELVALSACEAGAGQLLRGEGVVGLVRAFTFAGARSVAASLWLANDQGTARLMTEFYRQLLRGLPKDSALQAARQQLARQFPGLAHPFFWAGFRVYGAVEPLW